MSVQVGQSSTAHWTQQIRSSLKVGRELSQGVVSSNLSRDFEDLLQRTLDMMIEQGVGEWLRIHVEDELHGS